MSRPNLTDRERLALELEDHARGLRTLLDRFTVDPGAPDDPMAPNRDHLARVYEAVCSLDRAGLGLAPDLYRRAKAQGTPNCQQELVPRLRKR